VSLEQGKLGAIAVAAVGVSRQRLGSGKTFVIGDWMLRGFSRSRPRERFAAAASSERLLRMAPSAMRRTMLASDIPQAQG
jgi:hypothetical protein